MRTGSTVPHRPRAPLVLAVLLLGSACATPPPPVPREPPSLPPGMNGAVVFLRGLTVEQESAWNDRLLIAGPRGEAPTRSLTRLPDGRWRTGVIDLEISTDRITGPDVNLNFTRVDGGFRVVGLWLGRNVELLLDGRGATAQGVRFAREADGGYVSKEVPGWRIYLVGQAAWLGDPPWPELPLAALCGGWGVR